MPAGNIEGLRGVYADLVTAADFKSVVAAEKSPGGFDSHPFPFFLWENAVFLRE